MNDKLFKTIQLLLLTTIAIVLITKMDDNRYEYIGEYKFKTSTMQNKRTAIFDKQTGDIYIATYGVPKEGTNLLDLINPKNPEVNFSVKKANFKKRHEELVNEKENNK